MRGGKPGESELILQGQTDSPSSTWGWGEVQAPHKLHRGPTTTISPLEHSHQTLIWDKLTPGPQGMALP